MDLRIVRHQSGQDAAESQCLVTQLGAEPVVAGRGRVALVVDEVHDLEHRAESLGQLWTRRDLEADAGVRDGLLGPDDALRNGGLGYEIGAGDLGHREAPDEPQGEGDAAGDGEDRVAGHEDQAEAVVVDVVRSDRDRVEPVTVGILAGRRLLELGADPAVLGGERSAATELVDRLSLPDGGQPRAGVLRCAVTRPLPQGVDQRLLRQLLGQVEVAGEVRQ